MAERCLKVFLMDDGKVRLEGPKFTIGELEEVGKTLIQIVKQIQIEFNAEKPISESGNPLMETR